MIRYLSGFLLLLVSGCAPDHYIARQSNGVTVYLDVPEASKVVFVSSADDFKEHPLYKNSRGLWTISNLADREFDYFFIVDGRVYVPECRYKEKDDFGAANCIYEP